MLINVEGQPESIVKDIEDMVRLYVEKVITYSSMNYFSLVFISSQYYDQLLASPYSCNLYFTLFGNLLAIMQGGNFYTCKVPKVLILAGVNYLKKDLT